MLRATCCDFGRCDLASVERAIREPMKGRSKAALRFAGAWARTMHRGFGGCVVRKGARRNARRTRKRQLSPIVIATGES